MAETDLGATLGKQWSEGQDTRSQLGTGDTIVWVENYPLDLVVEPINIFAKRSFAGSTFTVGLHLLGSQHKYTTTGRLNLGSFTDGVEESTGSIVVSTGSTNGSWISPKLFYSSTVNYDATGVQTDTGSRTWRHLSYDYGGSVIVNLYDYDDNTKVGSFVATGSDDLEYNLDVGAGSDIRLMFDLGSPTSWVGSPVLAYQPALLGSTITEAIGRLSEARIYQNLVEDFTTTGSIDTGLTTGSIGGGSVIIGSAQSVQSISLSDDWQLSNFDRFLLTSTGSSLAGSVTFSTSSDDGISFTNVKRGIEKQIGNIGSRVKWKANYNLATGSAVIETIDLTYKSDDY